jgi:hypothetical protein
MNVVLMQREWSDNAVSNTLYFKPKYKQVKLCEDGIVNEYDPNHEEDDIEPVISSIAPFTKSISLLPHTADGVYAQTPETGITFKEYEERLARIKQIDWSSLRDDVAEPEKYCTGDTCLRPTP